MANGEVYAQVDASVVNGGIAPMAIVSGNPTPVDGQAVVVVWIRWRYDDATGDGGYTGTGWYFNDSNNGLRDFTSEAEFKNYLTGNKTQNLDDILSKWDATEKAAFLNTHLDVLEENDCVYFAANS